METSIFSKKDERPDNFMLSRALGDLYSIWMEIRSYVINAYPDAIEEWNFPGQKYGWNFRIKDKKRAIVYLLPRESFFLVALVFGEKATSEALQSTLNQGVKDSIASAKVYAEGRGFRIEVRNANHMDDIKKLIDIKLSH
jgi:hypothetical protein